MKYKNPIIPGYYPDPSICRVGADFYLVNWRQIGYCLTRPSQLPLDGCRASGGVWAPTLRYHDGTFYMTSTNTTGGGHFYVTAKDPAGPWSEPVWVAGAGFDSSFFFDDDGLVYFQWFECEQPAGIYQTEIDIATGEHLTEPKVIWDGSGGRSPEGPHLYKIDGLYYLMAAEGGTEDGHMITIARGKSPWGPWESCPHNPILSHRSLDRPIQTTGHGDLIQDADGSWWMVFLGTRSVGYPRYHILGRETFLAPVTWEAGWPIVGDNGTVDLEMDGPLPNPDPWEENEPTRDDFDQPALGLHWNWVRNPSLERYSTTERLGWLRLMGSEATLNDEVPTTFLGRRQRHFKCRVTTRVDFNPLAENEEAGLVVLGDNRHHYEIGITYKSGRRIIFVRRRIGTLQTIVAQQSIPNGLVSLSINADETWYTFSFATGDDHLTELAKGETRYLCTEAGAAVFTSTYFGVYATGNGKPCQIPADFDYFEVKIED